MIRFRCTCRNWLEVPESEAGGAVQCPTCGRLRSVPELDELPGLDDDGTFRLGEDAWRQRVGVRPTGTAGPYETPRPIRPRHDPETGEAMAEIGLADDPPAMRVEPLGPEPAPVLSAGGPVTLGYATPRTPNAPHQPVLRSRGAAEGPVAAAAAVFVPQRMPPQPAPAPEAAGRPPTLAYAGRRDYGRFMGPKVPIPLDIRPVTWRNIPLELLQPANALVLGITFALHLVVQFFGTLAAAGALPFVLLAVLVLAAILAHYVSVIDETGPEGRDEMPGLLRNVSFADDFAGPLWSLVFSACVCFAPAAVAYRLTQLATVADTGAAIAVVGLAAVGLLCFPPVLLTASTSGSIWNLAPARVVAVVLAAPAKFAVALLFLLLSLACYTLGTGMAAVLAVAPSQSAGATAMPVSLLGAAAIGYPALFGGIYFAHAFAWELGKTYQDHHAQFPWVLQRHVSGRTDELKVLERAKLAELRARREADARRSSEQVRSRLAAPPAGPRLNAP